MKFACLVYIDHTLIGALDAQQGQQLTDDAIDFDWELQRSGRLVLCQPLKPPAEAVTIRSRQGRISRTDGPFTETKEFLGGFFLIEAATIEEAVALATTSPMAAMGAIEVRPFLEQQHSVTGEGRPQL